MRVSRGAVVGIVVAAAIGGLIVSEIVSPHSPKPAADHAWSVSETSIVGRADKTSVYGQFDKIGADRSKPMVVDFHSFFDADRESAAHRAGSILRRSGYTIVVEQVDTGEWELTASRKMLLQPRAVDVAQAEVQRVVEDHGGEYDGFGAAVPPRH